MGTVKEGRQRRHVVRKDVHLVMLMLDVKNTFNSTRWDDMIRSLEQDFRIPRHLKVYLRDRRLLYDTFDGRRQRV